MSTIERIAVTVAGGDATKTIRAGEGDRVVRLLAIHVTTEAADADFIIEDEDGNNIGGKHHNGKGSGGAAHATVDLNYNPVGWAETPIGKGMRVLNEDAAAFELLAVVAII